MFEDLEITRWVLRASDGSEIIIHTNKQQEANREQFMDKDTGQEMEIADSGSFLEWIAEKHRDFGATLEFVSDRSSEGNQFVKGFGGIGAIVSRNRSIKGSIPWLILWSSFVISSISSNLLTLTMMTNSMTVGDRKRGVLSHMLNNLD